VSPQLTVQNEKIVGKHGEEAAYFGRKLLILGGNCLFWEETAHFEEETAHFELILERKLLILETMKSSFWKTWRGNCSILMEINLVSRAVGTTTACTAMAILYGFGC
jgi:hypothetical protein